MLSQACQESQSNPDRVVYYVSEPQLRVLILNSLRESTHDWKTLRNERPDCDPSANQFCAELGRKIEDTKIKRVELDRCSLNADQALTLARALRWTSVKILDLSRCDIWDCLEELLCELKHTSVVNFSLGGVQFNDGHASILARNMSTLKSVSIYHSSMTAKGIREIIDAIHPKLLTLELHGMDLGDDVLRDFAIAVEASNLTRVALLGVTSMGHHGIERWQTSVRRSFVQHADVDLFNVQYPRPILREIDFLLRFKRSKSYDMLIAIAAARTLGKNRGKRDNWLKLLPQELLRAVSARVLVFNRQGRFVI